MNFEHIGQPRSCLIVNEPSPIADPEEESLPTQRTVVIGGVPRGGTTMVAAVTEALGVYLGPEDDLRTYTFEDQRMNQPHPEIQYKQIKLNNEAHDVWGWKDPGAIHPLKEIAHALRQPRVIIVFRDMIASIQGEIRFSEQNGQDPRPLVELIENTTERIFTNLMFAKNTQLPTMLVSYEQAVKNKEEFVDSLINFIGIEVSDDRWGKAIDRISPSGGYMQW